MSEYSDRIKEQKPVSDGEFPKHSFETELDTVKAIAFAQEIARELLLDRLLVRLLEILRQTTQAQRIYLLEKQDRWSLIAADDMGAEEIEFSASASLEIPTAIIDYVAQTKASLILNDAANEGEFVKDPDVKTQQIKSVLCVPLLELDFRGALYLENNSLAGVFTPQLLHNLQIITTQAAISINNARQHHQVTDSVQRLERELRDREAALQASQAELAGMMKNGSLASKTTALASNQRNFRPFSKCSNVYISVKSIQGLASVWLFAKKRSMLTGDVFGLNQNQE